MKRAYITTLLTCLSIIAVVFALSYSRGQGRAMKSVTVGFIYESDESAPYTYNFALAQTLLEEELRDSVNIITRNNVPDDSVEEILNDLVTQGCNVVFTNCHSKEFAALAPSFPEVQICQVSDMENIPADRSDNYHTFNGKIYQARYVSGVAAGLKLKELIDNGTITSDEAVVGYVGAFPTAAVISGYTSFLMGIRSVVPEAVMRVKYTQSWASYRDEKACAKDLIDEGCIVISQHSDTTGPAIACEEAYSGSPIIFVGCNRGLLDIAPATALLSIRINWAPYIIGAVKSVMNHRSLESGVPGDSFGNDIVAGFSDNALEIMDLNGNLAAKGTQKAINEAVKTVTSDPAAAFRGNYTGVDPDDPSDTIDLSDGFVENAKSSAPEFHYVLEDITVDAQPE